MPTVVASKGRPLLTVASGNPGLATGGSGDVLSGLIGAALAQGVEPEVAAALGAQALGRAADMAARRMSARSMRPMDVVASLADLWREWEVLRRSPPPPHPPVLLELPRPRRCSAGMGVTRGREERTLATSSRAQRGTLRRFGPSPAHGPLRSAQDEVTHMASLATLH